MRKILTLLLVLFFFISSNSVFAQVHSTYASQQMLIKFEAGTAEEDITRYKDSIHAVELWVTPITKTRLWELNNFQGIQEVYDDSTIDDIIGTIIVQDGRDDIDEVGLNFDTKITPGSSGGNGQGGGANGDPLENDHASFPTYTALCNRNITKPGGKKYGLRIAVLDTGNEKEFSGIVADFEYNYITDTYDAIDLNGHGTSMANLIGQSFEANSKFGVKDLEWDFRVTHNANGIGNIADILLAMEEAADDGADVINMSFSYVCTDTLVNKLFEESIEVLEEMNILINASAGNQEINNDDVGESLRAYPATYEVYNIISVAAFNCFSSDISSFSNWGEYSVDITAPGNEIEGFNFQPNGASGSIGGPTGAGVAGNGTPYSVLGNGCSQATAITSGLALALGSYQSSWDYKEVKCAILKGAQFRDMSQDILTSGIINGQRALKELYRGCDDIIDTPTEGRNAKETRNRDNENSISDQASVKAYPNPVSETLNVEISMFTNYVNVQLYNSQGQLVRSIPNQFEGKISINVSELNSGLYMIKCESEDAILTKSVIIE